MKATIVTRLRFCKQRVADLWRDSRGIAATEFAVIVPIMLVLFFGTVEFSQAVAVDRKVTLITRTLADLTSQAITADNTYMQNVFTASITIMTPYSPTPTRAQISEVYIDSNLNATVQWSQGAVITSAASQATLAASSRNAGDNVTSIIPNALLVRQTYLILSEASYQYVPTVGYVMAPSGVNMRDIAYTRPRQKSCVTYNNLPAGNCPTP